MKEKKLNILFISSWYPSKEHLTLGNFVQKHAEIINPLVNLKILYVTSKKSNTSLFSLENSIINNVDTTVVYYKKVTSKIPFWSTLLKLKRYISAYKFGLNYLEEKKQFKFIDLIHCNITFEASLFARYLKFKKNIPYIISEHSTQFSSYNNSFQGLSFIKKRIIRKGIKHAKCILPVSNHLKISMQNLGFDNIYQVVPNSIDTDLFKPQSIVVNKEKKTILHISHLDNAQKNIEGMLRVIQKISSYRSDFIFKIVADDNIESTKNLISHLNISEYVQLETTKTSIEVVQIMQKASFFILFSNYETFSVVLAEAWSCGLPVIYSKCGGLTEIIDPKLGIQIKPLDNDLLEKSIVKMLDTIEDYDLEYIRKYAENNFNSKILKDQLFSIYKSVTKA